MLSRRSRSQRACSVVPAQGEQVGNRQHRGDRAGDHAAVDDGGEQRHRDQCTARNPVFDTPRM